MIFEANRKQSRHATVLVGRWLCSWDLESPGSSFAYCSSTYGSGTMGKLKFISRSSHCPDYQGADRQTFG